MMHLAGQAQYRRSRLNSNVRPRTKYPVSSYRTASQPCSLFKKRYKRIGVPRQEIRSNIRADRSRIDIPNRNLSGVAFKHSTFIDQQLGYKQMPARM